MIGFLVGAAKSVLLDVIGSYAKDVKDSARNTAKDTFESTVTAKRTIDEWAEVAIKGVDQIKNRAVNEGGLRYVGGKLKFAMSAKNPQKIVISFELYFLDENGEWQKVGADSDMHVSIFTHEALEEIRSKCEVSFEVE